MNTDQPTQPGFYVFIPEFGYTHLTEEELTKSPILVVKGGKEYVAVRILNLREESRGPKDERVFKSPKFERAILETEKHGGWKPDEHTTTWAIAKAFEEEDWSKVIIVKTAAI